MRSLTDVLDVVVAISLVRGVQQRAHLHTAQKLSQSGARELTQGVLSQLLSLSRSVPLDSEDEVLHQLVDAVIDLSDAQHLAPAGRPAR